jgi:hypothetical protein
MGTTVLKKRGINPARLTDKMRAFCEGYVIDFNGTRAAKAVSYAHPGIAAAKLLANPLVQTYISQLMKARFEDNRLTAGNVLKSLEFAFFFNPLEWFTPANGGRWCCESDPRKLPAEVGRLIKSVNVYEDENKRAYEVELLPHGTELSPIIMKHLGMFPKETQEHVHNHLHVNHDQLCGAAPPAEDRVQKYINGPPTS